MRRRGAHWAEDTRGQPLPEEEDEPARRVLPLIDRYTYEEPRRRRRGEEPWEPAEGGRGVRWGKSLLAVLLILLLAAAGVALFWAGFELVLSRLSLPAASGVFWAL